MLSYVKVKKLRKRYAFISSPVHRALTFEIFSLVGLREVIHRGVLHEFKRRGE